MVAFPSLYKLAVYRTTVYLQTSSECDATVHDIITTPTEARGL